MKHITLTALAFILITSCKRDNCSNSPKPYVRDILDTKKYISPYYLGQEVYFNNDSGNVFKFIVTSVDSFRKSEKYFEDDEPCFRLGDFEQRETILKDTANNQIFSILQFYTEEGIGGQKVIFTFNDVKYGPYSDYFEFLSIANDTTEVNGKTYIGTVYKFYNPNDGFVFKPNKGFIKVNIFGKTLKLLE